MKTFYLILEFIHTLLHHVLDVVRHKNNVSNKVKKSEESLSDTLNSDVVEKKGSDNYDNN